MTAMTEIITNPEPFLTHTHTHTFISTVCTADPASHQIVNSFHIISFHITLLFFIYILLFEKTVNSVVVVNL